MIISNTRFQNYKRRIYTWKIPGDITHYQIYYILVNNRFQNLVKFYKVYPSEDCDSDHSLVIAKCELTQWAQPARRKGWPQRTTIQALGI